MKKACIAALVSFAVFSGCGVGAEVEGEENGVQREALLRAEFPRPLIPSTPTAYKPGVTPLFPKTVASAVTYIAQSRSNPDEFEAWGFDVVSRECVFYVRASERLFSPFRNDLQDALDMIPKGNPTYIGYSIQGQPRLPTPIGPGGDPWLLSINASLRQ